MIDLTASIKHFASLNRAPGPTWTAATKRKAPHKPLLLLAVLDLVHRGIIASPFIAVTGDLVELNEAFAPQVLAVLRGWGWDERDRLNVNGSGISLGHPIGATGGRILANLLRELHRRDGRYGLETMCIGGGQGIAAIFERA